MQLSGKRLAVPLAALILERFWILYGIQILSIEELSRISVQASDLSASRVCLIAKLQPYAPAFPQGNVDSFAAAMDSFERLLWWLFAGSTGAETRFEVLSAIKEQPRNAQQLSQLLGLDYTTVRHHLRVLELNRLVVTEGEKYGKLYFLSDTTEANWQKLLDIVARTRKQKANKSSKIEGGRP